MPIDEFDDLMVDDVTIEPYSSQSDYGVRSYQAAQTYKCRLSATMRQIVDTQGVQRTSLATIYIMGNTSIGPYDRITLPSTFTPQQPPIISVSLFTDESGAHHTRIYC